MASADRQMIGDATPGAFACGHPLCGVSPGRGQKRSGHRLQLHNGCAGRRPHRGRLGLWCSLRQRRRLAPCARPVPRSVRPVRPVRSVLTPTASCLTRWLFTPTLSIGKRCLSNRKTGDMQDHGSSPLKRRLQIVDLARKSDAVKVEALSALFGVSTVTIRNDLNYLEQQGYVGRTFGRARYNPALLNAVPQPQESRATPAAPLLSLVAGAALHWIADGMALFLGGGALVHRLLPQLVGKPGLALPLHDLSMVAPARQVLSCEIHVAGGAHSDEEPGLIGPAAELGLRSHPVDLCVIEVSGIDARGRILSQFAGAARLYAAAVGHCSKAISLARGLDAGAGFGHPVCGVGELDAFVVHHDIEAGVFDLLAEHQLRVDRKAGGVLEFRKA